MLPGARAVRGPRGARDVGTVFPEWAGRLAFGGGVGEDASMVRSRSGPILAFVLAGTLGAGCGARDDRHAPTRAPAAATNRPPPLPSAEAPTAAPLSPSPPEAPAGLSEDEIARLLAAIPPDPAPDRITMDTHFVVSNEDRPQVFRERVAGRGGVYVGVGAEQSFLFGGWARAERMFLLDFDEWVVTINEIHGLVFEHARTPDELFELWGPEHRAEVESWVREGSADPAIASRKMKIYDRGRPQVQYRLKWLRLRLSGLGIPFFANDQAELDHVAGLWRSKRVRAVRGDLTASGALRAFGDLARRAGWTVRVLYLSNAEQYFAYDTGAFRDNLAALPIDDRSVVLHTTPTNKMEYFYIWQEASTYVPWASRVHNFRDLLYEARVPYLGKLENGAWLIKPPP